MVLVLIAKVFWEIITWRRNNDFHLSSRGTTAFKMPFVPRELTQMWFTQIFLTFTNIAWALKKPTVSAQPLVYKEGKRKKFIAWGLECQGSLVDPVYLKLGIFKSCYTKHVIHFKIIAICHCFNFRRCLRHWWLGQPRKLFKNHRLLQRWNLEKSWTIN